MPKFLKIASSSISYGNGTLEIKIGSRLILFFFLAGKNKIQIKLGSGFRSEPADYTNSSHTY
ncbi:MAG: hypothetical protein J7K00_03855 [Candidatus Diapherotrites archaeon]|nr:hypothetical protein [Candidatus Diapherotrites archaeon]